MSVEIDPARTSSEKRHGERLVMSNAMDIPKQRGAVR
jgi:hypothetical protein